MINNCYCNLRDKSQFSKWIVEQLGPLLLGAKPAEILSFPTHNSLNDCTETVEQLLKTNKSIGYKILHPPKGCMKIFFFNIKILDNTLSDNRIQKFLKGLGYPQAYNLECYLRILTSKLNNGEMPHEIGVFLGYPLKDVIGFIGHPSLKLTKVNRWRVYGNPKISDTISQRIVAAKNRIKEQLEYSEPNQIVSSVSSEDFLEEYINSQYYIVLCYFLSL